MAVDSPLVFVMVMVVFVRESVTSPDCPSPQTQLTGWSTGILQHRGEGGGVFSVSWENGG